MSSQNHGSNGTPVVWVVDDDVAVGVALSRLLRAAALHVIVMRSARELLEALAHSAPDCSWP